VRIVCIGEIIWDVIEGKEHLGGAPLNFAAHGRKLGHETFLLSAVGDDERGRRALDGLLRCGISTEFVQVLPGKNTGTAEVEVGTDGKPTFQIVRPAAYDFVKVSSSERQRIAGLQPDWIYMGTLYHTSRHALESTLQLLDAMPLAARFYDINLREGNWSLTTVDQLASRATVIKLSDSEAEFLDGSLNTSSNGSSVEDFCRRWLDRYGCKTICVTLGERGCAIYTEGSYTEIPGHKVEVADTVGAGDAFAAAFLHGVNLEWDLRRCGIFANATGALVASRPGAIPEWNVEEVWEMVEPS
jgi:fructokinase